MGSSDDTPTSNASREDGMAMFTGVLGALKKSSMLDLCLEFLELCSGEEVRPDMAIGKPMCGAHHIIFPIDVNGTSRWAIRIPATGTKGKWSKESEAALVSEALTTHTLGKSTTPSAGQSQPSKLPVPRVWAYSATPDNPIGCPYIALSFVEGKPLYDVWYQNRLQPGSVDDATVRDRQMRILRGMADAMAHLGSYKFPKGGSLLFDDKDLVSVDGHTFLKDSDSPPIIGIGSSRFPDQEAMLQAAAQASERRSTPPQPTTLRSRLHRLTSEFIRPFKCAFNCVVRPFGFSTPHHDQGQMPSDNKPASLDESDDKDDKDDEDDRDDEDAILTPMFYNWGPTSDVAGYVAGPLDVHVPTHPYQQGVHELLRKLISWIPNPFTGDDEANPFVLMHPDLNTQNILVDEDGRITGIIDWDGVAAVPRCLGNESCPPFLTRDWDPKIYMYDLLMDQSSSRQSFSRWEDSPETLRSHRKAYRELMAEEQSKTAPFSPFFKDLCRQSVVTESIVIAAYDPMSRLQILEKVVDESWKAYRKSTHKDYTHLSSYRLIQKLVDGDMEDSIMEALEKAFRELLRTVES